MPREGVPYPERLVCSLKCAVARIEQALGLKMNSVNGVGPDGQGDVKLISDSAALTVTDVPTQNEVHLDLDTSLLPAADVNSVNGQTGAVVLDGDDLDGVTPGNSVNDDITALQGTDVTLQGNINAEALARSGADSTLQTNINAVTAALPSAAAAAVAADPTVAQLVYDVGQAQSDITTLDNTTLKTTNNQMFTGRKQGWNSIGEPTSINNLYKAVANLGAVPTSGTTTIIGLVYDRAGASFFRFSFNASLTISNQERVKLGNPAAKIGIADLSGTLYLVIGGATSNDIACLMNIYVHKGSSFTQPIPMIAQTVNVSDFIEAVFP